MNPLFLEIPPKAREALLAVHVRKGDSYFDALHGLLDRAKRLAAGLGSAADTAAFMYQQGKPSFSLSDAETAALALTIAEQIEAAQALLGGLFEDLRAVEGRARAADGGALAAAAPELLAALRDIAAATTETGDGAETLAEIQGICRAAIAKARGGVSMEGRP